MKVPDWLVKFFNSFFGKDNNMEGCKDMNENNVNECKCGGNCSGCGGDCQCGGDCKCGHEDTQENEPTPLELFSGCCQGNCDCGCDNDGDGCCGNCDADGDVCCCGGCGCEEEPEVVLSLALNKIMDEIEFVRQFLKSKGRCENCEGYKIFDLNNVQVQLLKSLGFTLPETAKYCDCNVYDVEFVVESEDDSVSDDTPPPITRVHDKVLNPDEIKANFATVESPEVFNTPVEIIWACAEGVEPPTKNEEDLGFDVKAFFPEDEFVIKAHETRLVPTGLYAALPTLWGLIAREKGSTGAIGMKCGAGVVDSGYRGEIFIAITNENEGPIVITKDPAVTKPTTQTLYRWDKDEYYDVIYYPYKKGIAQLLVKFNPRVETKVVSIEELQAIPSKRGTGKLGSTDKF